MQTTKRGALPFACFGYRALSSTSPYGYNSSASFFASYGRSLSPLFQRVALRQSDIVRPFVPCLNYASKPKRKPTQQFLDEGIYEVVRPEGKKEEKKEKASKETEVKRKKEKAGTKPDANKEPKPRITLDVLTMLQEEERIIQGGGQKTGRRCHGCGVLMQSTDPGGLGYRPAQTLNVEVEGKEAVCQRCHFLKYQNKVIPIKIAYTQLKEQLSAIKSLKVLVVKIVDIFDFSGSWIENFRDIAGANPIVLVANKVDLLPPDIGQESVKAWLRQAVNDANLKNVRAIHLVSGKSGKGLGRFAEKLEKLRRGRDVYVVGCTNVGKSTLINRLLFKTKGPKHRLLTTSSIPGTTLNLISFPIGARRKHRQQAHLYDTPGIVNECQMARILTPEELKVASPAKTVKPKIIRMVPGKALFFGGLARVDYVEGPCPLLFTLFLSSELPVHPTDMSKADELYASQVGVLHDLQPPFGKERATMMPPFILKEVSLTRNDTNYQKAFKDIVYGGLGWLSISGALKTDETIKLRVGSPRGIGIFLREPLMPLEASLKKGTEAKVIKHGKWYAPDKERIPKKTTAESNEKTDTQKEEKKEKQTKKEEEDAIVIPGGKGKKSKGLEAAALELLDLDGEAEEWDKGASYPEEDEEEEDEEDEDEEDRRPRRQTQNSQGKTLTKEEKKRKRWKRTKWWLEKKDVKEAREKKQKSIERVMKKNERAKYRKPTAGDVVVV